MQWRRANELVHTSQIMIPKAYISLASVGSVEFDDAPGQVNSGAQIRESRSVLVVPSAIRVGFRGADTLPRPAIRGVPSLAIRIFA